MTDPITIAAAVGTIFTSVNELTKSARAVAKEIEDVEQRGRMLGLMEQLQRAQLAAMESIGRVAELEQENKALKKQLVQRAEMKQEGDVLYQYLGDGTKDGPFCLHGSLKREREVRLVDGDEYVQYRCPSCRTAAGVTKPRPPAVFVV